MRYAILSLCGSIILCAALAGAGTTGKIVGRVIDKSTKDPLPGANIVLEGTAQGATADASGAYVIVDVQPGTHRLRASYIGYGPLTVQNLRVNINQTTEITFELTESAVQATEMTIVAERPMVRKDATGSVSIVTHEEIQVLPVQSFVDVLRAQAGVVGEGSALHIRGGRGNEVAYLIDGVYVEDPLFGGLGTQLHNDAIEQMEFLSGTFSAEYGDAMSGVVNLVTRQGTDRFRFKLEGRTGDFFVKPFSTYHENRFVASASGPIPLLSGSTFFASVERDARGSWLPFGHNRDLSVFGKASTTAWEGMRLTGSYRYTSDEHQNYSHSYKYIPWMYYQPRASSHQLAGQFTHFITPTLFYDVRLSYFTQRSQLGILDASGEYLDTSRYVGSQQIRFMTTAGNGINDFYAYATPEGFDSARTATFNAKADLVWQLGGSHEIKAGLELKSHSLMRYEIFGPKRTAPYTNNYTREPYEGAVYLQDKVELPALVLNVGLRVDYADQNASFRVNPYDEASTVTARRKIQVSPRIGIAYPVSERTNVSFSYGHFFQNPEYQYLFQHMSYDFKVREPIFGQPDLDAQQTVAYQGSVSHQFGDNFAGTATLYYKDITGLVGTHYTPAYAGGTNPVGYTLYINEDYANIKGFELNFTLRRSKYIAGGVTYSYQVAKGSASSEEEQYPGTQESTSLYYLGFDKTHSLSANLSLVFGENQGPDVLDVRPLENTYFNILARASSGYPYTPSGRDIGFVVRNSALMPWSFVLDVEAGREWNVFGMRLTTFLEVLNLTDFKNVVSIYTDTGLPDATLFPGQHSEEWIKDPSNFGPPRRMRLGLRLVL
ncbi:MAG TPA: TonB-dependent receptor [Bacteroidota bacterium]|nr:TonB-dependent receptor [Bacteroidota bacterium]